MKTILLLAVLSFGFMSYSCKSTKMAQSDQQTGLNGSWQLNYISGPRITFDGLYPGKKPFLTLDVAALQVLGNTSCNSLNGPFTLSGQNISFQQPMAMTKMMCEGGGETTFMQALKQVDNYTISKDGKELSLNSKEVTVLKFDRK